MRTGKKQLTLAASALAMAVALTGCGGGGGTALKDAGSGSGLYTGTASFADTWTAQHSAIRTAIAAAQGDLNMLSLTSTDMDLDEAQKAVDAISSAIAAGTYLSASEKADYEAMQTALMATLAAYKAGLMEADRLEGELTMAEAEVTRLTGELTMSQGDNKDLQDKLDMANGEVTRLTGELTMSQGEVTKLTGELTMSQGEVTKLTGDLGMANGEVTRLTGELAVANGKIETLEDQIERQDGDLQALNDQLSAEKLKVAQLQTDLQSEKDMVAQLQTDLQSEKDMVAQLQTDLQSEKDMVAQLQTDLQSEKDTVAQLQTDLQSEKDMVAQLQTDLQSEKDTVADLQGQLDAANRRIAFLEGHLDEARQGPQRVAVQKAITELEMALAKVDASASEDDVKAADAALTAARQAITDATYLPEEETDGLTGDVNTIAGTLTTAKMDRTTSLAAATKEMAIMDEAAQGADGSPTAILHANAGLGGTNTADGTAVTTYSMTISRGSSGPAMVKITDDAMADDDDPKFTKASDVNAMTSMHTRMMEADDDGNIVEEVVVVTTDIDAATATAFTTVYPIHATTGVNTDTTNDPDGGTATFEALTIDETSSEVLGRVMSGSFTASTAATLTFDMDDSSTANTDEADEVAGTYDGAMGTYRCNGSDDCTVSLDADGMILAMSNGWIFTPAMGAMVDVADDDYLHYGFWLKKTTDKDGMVTYNEVETFAGSDADPSNDVSAVTGMAKYEGGATGVYVHTEDRPDGIRKKATSGHFTADASLTASFGGNSVAVDNQHMLSGTIDSFVLSGGEANAWSVTLESSAASTNGTHSGTAKGGVGDGSFTATFHGSVTADEDGGIPQPHTVVGEFNAGFTNGSVAGAFGAGKMDE